MSRRHILIPDSLASLFLRLEELVLANSGEDEFEEIFKLLVAKLWSERTGAKFRVGSSDRETFDAMSDLLGAACRKWTGLFAPGETFKLSPEHLHACVGVLKGFKLLESGAEALDATFEFLTSRAAKGVKGQFFTPRHVVDFCVRMTRPTASESVLDPACGSGAFLLHTLNYLREKGQVGAASDVARYSAKHLWGFDFDARAVRIAKALMLVAGDGHANLIRLNSLTMPDANLGLFSGPRAQLDTPDAPLMTIEDVLRARRGPQAGFDVVLTNPPFAGEIRERGLLDSYLLGAKKDHVERDVLFLERCIGLLRPGGRMAIVLPHNKFASGSFTDLRDWLLDRLQLVAAIGLGRNTFMPHTSQKASVLFGIKRAKGGRRGDEQVFFGVSERDGKDARGIPLLRTKPQALVGTNWRDTDHDLDDLLRAFDNHVRETNTPWEAEA